MQHHVDNQIESAYEDNINTALGGDNSHYALELDNNRMPSVENNSMSFERNLFVHNGASNVNAANNVADGFDQIAMMQGVQTQGQGFQSQDVSLVHPSAHNVSNAHDFGFIDEPSAIEPIDRVSSNEELFAGLQPR